jgi:hypothetical protein
VVDLISSVLNTSACQNPGEQRNLINCLPEISVPIKAQCRFTSTSSVAKYSSRHWSASSPSFQLGPLVTVRAAFYNLYSGLYFLLSSACHSNHPKQRPLHLNLPQNPTTNLIPNPIQFTLPLPAALNCNGAATLPSKTGTVVAAVNITSVVPEITVVFP